MSIKIQLTGLVDLDDNNQNIIFNFDYFQRLFIKSTKDLSEGKITSLSSTALRIGAILCTHLNDREPKKLPSRSTMKKQLDVSSTAITKALEQLELLEFFIPGPDFDENGFPKTILKGFDKNGVGITELDLPTKKRFYGNYVLNPNFNLTSGEILTEYFQNTGFNLQFKKIEQKRGENMDITIKDCSDCNGTGYDSADGGQCDRCSGTGSLEIDENGTERPD